jgi:cysteinyl-tRNA synthetase
MIVARLLSLRVSAKRKRDFETADMIRDDLLRDHGVQIWDKV